MASKFDKPYRNVVLPDINKINSILSQSAEIDTQKILQLSMINKLPLPLVIDNGGNNLIHLAINNINNKSEFNIMNYIKFLVQQQVNPDQPNKENQTPLHLACQNQYLDIVNFLVEQHVNVNYQDNNGLTPLHYLLTGNNKVYDEKEITEFIVPNPEKKTNKVERKALLELKKQLWEILKDLKYQWVFEGIEKTIEDNIENNGEIQDKVLELKKKLANSLGDLKKNSDYYFKYRQDIEEIILKKWNKFAPSDDIEPHKQEVGSLLLGQNMGIIRNYDVKIRVKDNIKQSIKESLALINGYQNRILTHNLNEDLSKLLSDTLWNKIARYNTYDFIQNIIFPTYSSEIYQIEDKSIFSQLNSIYQEYKHQNAYDFADNITELEKLSFIGGSRKITIDDLNYDSLKAKLSALNLNTINKKVIFILLSEYFKLCDFSIGHNAIYDTIFADITNFDNINYNNFFQNLRIANQQNYDFSTDEAGGVVPANLDLKYIAIINIAEQSYKEIFVNKIDNVGPTIYCKYVNTLLQYSANNNNLDCSLHKLFFKLVAALNNDPNNLDESLTNVFKIDKLQIIDGLFLGNLNYKKAVWAAYLLTDNTQPIDNLINANDNNIANYLALPILDPIRGIIQAIIDPSDANVSLIKKDNIDDNKYQVIAKAILNYYNNMKFKFPKLYLLDLIYYILKPTQDILFINNVINRIDDDQIIFDQLPPSLNGVINILLEDKSNIVGPQLVNLNIYLKLKFEESNELNLLFNGCLPNLIEPDIFNINLVNVAQIVGPPAFPGINGQNTNNDVFKLSLHRNGNDRLFIFNPIKDNGNFAGLLFDSDQDPGGFNDPNTPLPFNYFYGNVAGNYLYEKANYFFYIQDRYRPPFTRSKELLLQNQINSYNKILNKIFKSNPNSYESIFTTLLSKRQKISSIYYQLYITTKLIINKQNEIISNFSDEDKENIKLFDLGEFTTKLNTINANIFLYYYLYNDQNRVNLPEFIYYKLNSNKYRLYNNLIAAPIHGNFELVGGALNLSNLDFIYKYYFGITEEINNVFPIIKDNKLPPSLEDNLDDFYQLNKIKFIAEVLETFIGQPLINNIESSFKLNINEDDKWSFIYFKIAKIIEELIRDRAMYSLKIAIDNKMLKNIVNIKQINPDLQANITNEFNVTTVLLQTLNDVDDALININRNKLTLNFYKFSDPNTYEKCNFIIYPNDYTNTDLLQQKYCIKINEKIIKSLLDKNAQPLLLDNNHNTCINPLLSSYNYNILQKVLTNRIYFNEVEFNKHELDNHIRKLYNNNYKDSIENFIKPQYEEIKLLVLSDQTNGNNLFVNLKNSFKICFYLMNEYLTDYLWRFDSGHQKEHFNDIIKILKYKSDRIQKKYLIDVANNNKEKLYNNDVTLIQKEFIELLNDEKSKLLEYKRKLDIELKSLRELGLSSINVSDKIQNNKIKIDELTNNIDSLALINNPYIKYTIKYKPGTTKKILNTYNKLLDDKGKGISNSIWSLLLEDEKLLENSFNLSLLQMLKYQSANVNDDIVEEYFNHISKPAHLYFENPKYTNPKVNKVMCYIYEVLVYLTKSQLCFAIEILFRKVIYNHIKNSYLSYDIGLIISKIDQIFNKSFIYKDNESSFMEVLYKEVPKKLVKNSITAFEDLDEKINFEPETPLNIIRDLVNLIQNSRSIIFTDELLLNLNTNVANYFDLFIGRTIKNWYVVCENVLKFVINQQRITKTLFTLQNIPRVSTVTGLENIPRVSTVTVIFNNNVGNKEVLVSRRGQQDKLNGTLISQGGRVESYESFEEAAVREAKEEAGIDINIEDLKLVYEKVIGETRYNNYYVVYDNRPIVNGPQPEHQFELQDIDNILGVPTMLLDGKNTRLAWVPLNTILPPAPPDVPPGLPAVLPLPAAPRAPRARARAPRARRAPRPNPIEDTLFTKILQKIELVIG
jgi:8-oxo-dGTP pyrophosphatase MutT (NUDIX family)